MKRTPLKRKTALKSSDGSLRRSQSDRERQQAPLRRRSRLRPMSHRRRSELKRRDLVRLFVLNRDQGCVARLLVPGVSCWGLLEVDEILGRGPGGDWLDEDNCHTLCQSHHLWKHANPRAAVALGLTKRHE